MSVREGQCRCGAVRVRAEGEPIAISLCHCLDCQRRTGSAFSVHADFPAETVTVAGTTRRQGRPADSGRQVRFAFCPDCGGTVFWEAELRPGAIGIPVGLFADPGFPPPRVAIFTEHAHPWVALPAGIPRQIGHGAPAPAPLPR